MQNYRTIWLSDIHLGTRGCQADMLLDFLKHTDSEHLIFVGDIIDFWSLKRSSYWPESHNTVVQKVLKKARHNTNVVFIPGNHDEKLREYIGVSLGGIEIHENYTHTLANGRQIFCVHGDIFDIITRCHKWLAIVGDVGYTFLLWLNGIQNRLRTKLGINHWSLSQYIKKHIKEAVSFISDYEDSVVREAKHLGVDMILCGHIHHAEIREIDNVTYINTGDWVESCTAIVEHMDGRLELLKWMDIVNSRGLK
jgi:UDP-2,3-diacylglucosamine pyrophosphatase LpxH